MATENKIVIVGYEQCRARSTSNAFIIILCA